MTVRTEAANRAKSEFLANMSHEIRTPMTVILGFSDLLASPNVSYQERREFLAGIQRNGKSLLELISNILDLSQIEANRLTLAKADCPLQQIIDDALSAVQVQAEKQGLALELSGVLDPGKVAARCIRLIRSAPSRPLRQAPRD